MGASRPVRLRHAGAEPRPEPMIMMAAPPTSAGPPAPVGERSPEFAAPPDTIAFSRLFR